jgi:hypothetical protein
VLDDDERARVLDELARIVRLGGLLVMSTHNLAYASRIRRPTQIGGAGIVRAAIRLALLPIRLRNRLRVQRLERTSRATHRSGSSPSTGSICSSASISTGNRSRAAATRRARRSCTPWGGASLKQAVVNRVAERLRRW